MLESFKYQLLQKVELRKVDREDRLELRQRIGGDREAVSVKIRKGVGGTKVQDVSVGQEDTQVKRIIRTKADGLSHRSIGECQEGDTLQKGNGYFEECTIRSRTVVDDGIVVGDTFF